MPDHRERDHREDVEIHGHPDAVLAKLAAQQHGVVARHQLAPRGVTRSMLERRLRSGHLVPLHRGVYAVGHRVLTWNGHWLAAVLAAGPGAVLSHREAAALQQLRPSNRTLVDVTVASQRRVPGIQLHRAAVPANEVTAVAGIPVTSVARTLVDLAGVVSATTLRKVIDEAERSNRLDLTSVEDVLTRIRHRRGRGHETMRHALADFRAAAATVTYSALEERFVTLLDAHGLPRPLTNANLHGIQVDAYWPSQRVVVELDGWAFHHTRQAFQRDRERSTALTLEGFVVLRFTYDHVVRRPTWVADRVARALTRYAAAPTG
jgi:hypothetical protein